MKNIGRGNHADQSVEIKIMSTKVFRQCFQSGRIRAFQRDIINGLDQWLAKQESPHAVNNCPRKGLVIWMGDPSGELLSSSRRMWNELRQKWRARWNDLVRFLFQVLELVLIGKIVDSQQGRLSLAVKRCQLVKIRLQAIARCLWSAELHHPQLVVVALKAVNTSTEKGPGSAPRQFDVV